MSVSISVRIATACAVAFCMTAASRPAAQGDAFAATVARLETAAINGQVDPVRTERVNLLRMLATAAPDRADMLRYTVAYAAWRLAFAPGLAAADQVTMLEDADAQLQRVLSSSPADVEALALSAAIDGARIAKNPDLGMVLGMKSTQSIDRAVRLAPSNPRVLVVAGEELFNTPPEYGGSISGAESRLRAALAAFDKEPGSKPWPNWGRFDAHAWLGQARAHRGDKAGARAEYAAALVLAPQSGWVRYELLPQVK